MRKIEVSDDVLETSGFVFLDEMASWKLVTHTFDNIHAVRKCGRIESFGSKDDAQDFVKRRAAEACINYALNGDA